MNFRDWIWKAFERVPLDLGNLLGSSFFSASPAAGAPAGAAPPAGAAAATLEIKAPMSAPLRALAKSPGQYPSTVFPLALITCESLASYKNK